MDDKLRNQTDSLPAWKLRLPNALTLLRLVLAAGFFAILSIYRFPDHNQWVLPVALVAFVVAAVTDALDGWLARKWNAISVFGRIMDPFADKILILGAFVILAGPNFAAPFGGAATGLESWMVIIIIARELLVTTIRAVCESRGIDFSASVTGKLKMIAQSVGVPVLLFLVWQFVGIPGSLPDEVSVTTWMSEGAYLAAQIVSWAITIITVWSAIPYVTRAVTALSSAD